MPRYRVRWSKTYHASGEMIIDAPTPEEALDLADERVGDETGSMQYDPDDTTFQVDQIPEEDYLTADQMRERDQADAENTRWDDFRREQ